MQGIKETLLRSMDLNLLISLHALLDERHITRAAERVGLSQPGMSRALNRLRQEFKDPLLVKGADGYELTPRAEALDAPLRQLVLDIQNIYLPPAFDPMKAMGEFCITALDYEFIVLLPLLTERLRRVAPGITIKALPFNKEDFGPLIRGEVHLVLTAIENVPDTLYRQQLFTERNVCMVNQLYLQMNENLTLERFEQLEHAWIYLYNPDPGKVDQTLSNHGLNRKIINTTPTFFLSAFSVASSANLITILPHRVERQLRSSMPIATVDMPIDFEDFKVCQIWHERYHNDEMHKFMRKLIADICRDV